MNKCEYCQSENVILNTISNEFVCIECASVQPEKYLISNDENNVTMTKTFTMFKERAIERTKRKSNLKLKHLIYNQYHIGYFPKDIIKTDYYKYCISNLIRSFNFEKNISFLIFHTFMENLNIIKKSNDRNLLICACIYVIQKNLVTFELFKKLHITKKCKHLVFDYVRLIQK